MADEEELIHVIPLRVREDISDGERYVSTVEIWSSSVVVRWTEPLKTELSRLDASGRPRPVIDPNEWVVADDVGTTYFRCGGGGGTRGRPRMDCCLTVVPCPPDAARTLTITSPSGRSWDVAIPV